MSAPTVVPTDADTPVHGVRVGVSELQSWLASGREPRVIDVREPAEYGPAHIPGSYNVPLGLLREHRHEIRAHLDQHIVLICRSGARATEAATILANAGVTHMHVLEGGMVAWAQAHAPSVKTSDKWELERQVRLVAGSLALTGVLASVVKPQAKWLSAVIGAGLVTAAVTDSCLMAKALMTLPYNREECSLQSVLHELAD